MEEKDASSNTIIVKIKKIIVNHARIIVKLGKIIANGRKRVQKLDYTFYDSTHAVVHAMDATLGHAVNADGNSSLFALRGLGLSTTLGAVYMHKRNPGAFDCNKTSDQFKKYDYRIGLSFLDIGMIDYFRQSQTLSVQT